MWESSVTTARIVGHSCNERRPCIKCTTNKRTKNGRRALCKQFIRPALSAIDSNMIWLASSRWRRLLYGRTAQCSFRYRSATHEKRTPRRRGVGTRLRCVSTFSGTSTRNVGIEIRLKRRGSNARGNRENEKHSVSGNNNNYTDKPNDGYDGHTIVVKNTATIRRW